MFTGSQKKAWDTPNLNDNKDNDLEMSTIKKIRPHGEIQETVGHETP